MTALRYISLIVVAAAVIVAAVTLPRNIEAVTRRDAVTLTDTVRRDTVVYDVRVVDSCVVRYTYRTITVDDTVRQGGDLLVKIPVSSYTFDVPKLGTIYASGYDVGIDSVSYTVTEIVTRQRERALKFNASVGFEAIMSGRLTPSVYAECGVTVKKRVNVYAGVSVLHDGGARLQGRAGVRISLF